jgi:hypothetical protein
MKIVYFCLILSISSLAYSGEIPIPDVKFLQDKTMSFEYIIGGSDLKFINDKQYNIAYGSEGWYWHNEGTYELRKGKIYLFPVVSKDNEKGPIVDIKDTMGEAVCVLVEDNESLLYTKKLRVTSLKNTRIYTSEDDPKNNFIDYDIKEFPVKAGSKRKIEDTEVLTLDNKLTKTIDNVKIRKKPSISSDEVKYSVSLYGEEAKDQDFVPKGTNVILIARTTEKKKVKAWNNYWYYVKVGICNGVWMYGEFIYID